MRRTITAIFVTVFGLIAVDAARAESLDFYKTTDGVNYTQCVGALSYTRTHDAQQVGELSLDEIDIYLADVGAMTASTRRLIGLEGTWTATNGSMAIVQHYRTSTRSWYYYTGSGYEGMDIGSFVNLACLINDGVHWIETGVETPNVNTTVTGSIGYSLGTSIQGSWINFDVANGLVDGDLVASFYVTPNAGLQFTAAAVNGTKLNSGVGFVDPGTSSSFGGYFTIAPEPSTLLLTACGAIGLLGFARRGRAKSYAMRG